MWYKNSRDTLKKHVENKWKIKYNIFTNKYPLILERSKKIQFDFRTDTELIEEAWLYSLIFSSKLEKAKIFRDKIFEEVLPSIRKYGQYKLKEEINTLTENYTKLQQRHNSIKLKRPGLNLKLEIVFISG